MALTYCLLIFHQALTEDETPVEGKEDGDMPVLTTAASPHLKGAHTMKTLEEQMQPLEEDELEDVSGGTNSKTYECPNCSRAYSFPGNCRICGIPLAPFKEHVSTIFIL